MKLLLKGKNWDKVTDGSCVISKANNKDYKDSFFGSFYYFKRYVDHYNKYDDLTDLGKEIYKIADEEILRDKVKERVKKLMEGDKDD